MIHNHMKRAIHLATDAQRLGLIPVGAVVVDGRGQAVGEGHNMERLAHDPTAHAEIVAIRRACDALACHRLDGFSLYTTLEPCIMCLGAIMCSRISRLYYGASDPKRGAFSCFHDMGRDLEKAHHGALEVYGELESHACGQLLSRFFSDLR